METLDEPEEVDLDERLWLLYLNDCTQKGLQPNIKDYLIWKSEEDYAD